MPNGQNLENDPDRPKIFRIRIQGHLGQQWTNWFDGLTITLEEDGNTLLAGLVTDQSALHGVLKKIRDLGMPLLSVHAIDPDEQTGNS
ncbi:MAG TPA: hypothetical protein PKL78_13425 [Anaerolineales bacterium]|nr:hypothetical protein [Anaerolineales bacterium]HNJ14342.1 hypothetical protein [Anaerolineales bacterium]HNN14554.1 hypothetical protein [Anaerolineales bacterium]